MLAESLVQSEPVMHLTLLSSHAQAEVNCCGIVYLNSSDSSDNVLEQQSPTSIQCVISDKPLG